MAGLENARAVMQALTELGVGPKSALGAVGSLSGESGFGLDPTSNNPGDGADGSDSRGFGQWNGSRAVALTRVADRMGLPANSTAAQIQHMKEELQGPYGHVLAALKAKDDIYNGADVWTRKYEVPANADAAVPFRFNRALQLGKALGADVSGVMPLGGAGGAIFRSSNTGLGDGTPGSMAVPATSAKTYADLYTPPEDSTPDQKMAHREDTAGLWTLTKDAYSTSSLTGSLFRTGQLAGYQADTAPYVMGKEEFDRRTTGLAPEYHDWFSKAITPEHADAIEQQARDHQQATMDLASAGWKGTGLSLLAGVLDPTAIAVGMATGGLGNAATKAYQLGTASRIAVNAALGAASNVAVDKGLEAAGDPEHHSLGMAIATGALFGGAYGLLSHGPHSDDIVAGARRSIGEVERDARTGGAPEVPEQPEIVQPKPPGESTGVPEVDDAKTRVGEIDTAPGEEPAATKTVNTQIVNMHRETRQVADLIQDLAAKFGIEKLIKVGRVEDVPGYSSALGLLQTMSDGSYQLRIKARGPGIHAQIEAAVHEFGHLLDSEFFGRKGGTLWGGTSDPEIAKAYAKWRVKAEDQSIASFFKEYLGPGLHKEFTKDGPLPTAKANTLSNWGYRVSSEEWFAQEVGKWAVSNQTPRSAIERAFGKVADYWKKLYYVATGEQPTASEAVSNFLKGKYDAQATPTAGYAGPAASAALEGPTTAAVSSVHVNPGRPTLASGSGLSGLGDDVARTALGNLRFSIAAKVGRSENPAVRALGAALIEDAPGKQGGAINGQSAELWAGQRTKAAQTAMAQSRKVAWDKWREENGLGYFAAKGREQEFEELSARAIRASGDPVATKDIPASIKQYAQNLHDIMEQARALAENPFHEEGWQGRPVEGFGATKEDQRYLTRVYSPKKISEIVAQPNGYAKLERLVYGSIRSAQPDMEEELLQRLSKHFTKSVYKRAYGVIDEKTARMFAVDNLESLERDLVHTHGLSEDDAQQIVNRLRKGSDSGNDSRAKHRVLMDENYKSPDGMSLSDVTVNNATALTAAYVRHMYGKTSLARLRIRDPQTNELVVNGITNEGEWNAALHTIREMGHDKGLNQKTLEGELSALQTAYEQIVGIPHPQADQNWAKLARIGQKFNLVRLGHQFTFAQAGEVSNMMGELGVKAMMQQVPSFKRIVTADGKWVKAQGLDREIESIFGLGTDSLRAHVETHHADDIRSLPMEATGFLDKADKTLTTAGHAVLELSGFHLLDGTMKQWTGKAIAQRFADMASKAKTLANGDLDVSHVNFRRMAKLGLDEPMLKRIINEVKGNFSMEKGVLFDHKVTRMNLDKWGDQEARIAFEGALTRYARQVIQENDIGSMHQWMSHPLWRMIMQFRAFPLHAWDKQLMHGIAMHDTSAVTSAVLGSAIPTLIYAMQSQLQALGRSDGNEWLEKRLAPDKLASAAFQRHGMSSLLPQAIDTGRMLLGQKGIFDARTTQQASDTIFGNPTTGLLTDTGKAIGGVVNPMLDGRSMSQDEARDIARVFGNNLVTNGLLNAMVRNLPAHAPKQAFH